MATFRLRYEKGHLIPIDPLPDMNDGDEIEVVLPSQPSREAVVEMLDRTRGLWAEWDDIEALIDDGRAKWDESWQKKIASS